MSQLSVFMATLDTSQTDDPFLYKGTTAADFAVAINSKTIKEVGRYGKWLFILFDSEPHVLMHFGMTGFVKVAADMLVQCQEAQNLILRKVRGKSIIPYKRGLDGDRIVEQVEKEWPLPYWKSHWTFDDGMEMLHCDQRRLGHVHLFEGDPLETGPLKNLGFDPLLSMPSTQEFKALVQKRRKPIKSLLLDQTFVAGVGNWIADEVTLKLHQSDNRHPSSCSVRSSTIPKCTQKTVRIA
jgi:formamidopyrimidine-DNA glycosylase